MSSMDPEQYILMRQVEDRHAWFRHLHGRVCVEIEKLAPSSDFKLLDAGCGTGGALQAMRKRFPHAELVGVDVFPMAVLETKRREVAKVLEASVEKLPFEDQSFDGVVSLDVLYIEGVDDKKAMKELARVTKKGGFLLLNLAAFEFLRGAHDAAVHTRHRYTKKEVLDLMRQNGFEPLRADYWNAAFFPLLALWRPFSRLLSGSKKTAVSDLKSPSPKLNRFLAGIFEAEKKWGSHLPFGSSIFAVGLKK